MVLVINDWFSYLRIWNVTSANSEENLYLLPDSNDKWRDVIYGHPFITRSSMERDLTDEARLDFFHSTDSEKVMTASRSASKLLFPSFIPNWSSASKS